jgi:hypothetical protein
MVCHIVSTCDFRYIKFVLYVTNTIVSPLVHITPDMPVSKIWLIGRLFTPPLDCGVSNRTPHYPQYPDLKAYRLSKIGYYFTRSSIICELLNWFCLKLNQFLLAKSTYKPPIWTKGLGLRRSITWNCLSWK